LIAGRAIDKREERRNKREETRDEKIEEGERQYAGDAAGIHYEDTWISVREKTAEGAAGDGEEDRTTHQGCPKEEVDDEA
jgi:hypothetical protein